MPEREFKVGTYCLPGETRKSKVNAYTQWYSPSWNADGIEFMEFTVSATSGKEAKALAVVRRLEHEAGRAALAEDS